MGCVQSNSDSVKSIQKDNARYLSNPKLSEPTRNHERTLLLLGAGETGKSTIMKQFKILYCGGFKEDERIRYRQVIYANIIVFIKKLIASAEEVALEFGEEYAEALDLVSETSPGEPITSPVATAISALWETELSKIQMVWQASSHFMLTESTAYFLSQLDRICRKTYIPTNDDILRCRAKTTGITEMQFEAFDEVWRLIDVGGQRSERRKWLNTYSVDQSIDALLYCVSMSSFDEKLYEDSRINRMEEESELFRQTCNSTWFRDAPTILILNKADVFREKIEKGKDTLVKRKAYDPTNDFYEVHKTYGPNGVKSALRTGKAGDFSQASEYLIERFSDLKLKGNDTRMECTVTNAMRSEDISKIFQQVVQMVKRGLEDRKD